MAKNGPGEFLVIDDMASTLEGGDYYHSALDLSLVPKYSNFYTRVMTFNKKNHHYVPQFWQKRFSDSSGRLFGRIGESIKQQVASKETMRGDWLYTVFDSQWNPSDSLENALSILEGSTADLFDRVCVQGRLCTTDDRVELCSSLALQACRHPDIMGRGHRLGKDFGALLASVHSLSLADFMDKMAKFGIVKSEAQHIHHILINHSERQLAQELNELNGLSQQDPKLPQQLVLLAQSEICTQLQKMEMILLDALPGANFVLGDTPIPQQDLSCGFSVPISKFVAVLMMPTSLTKITLARRPATTAEVSAINKAQWDNALQIVVGPSAAVLETL